MHDYAIVTSNKGIVVSSLHHVINSVYHCYRMYNVDYRCMLYSLLFYQSARSVQRDVSDCWVVFDLKIYYTMVILLFKYTCENQNIKSFS